MEQGKQTFNLKIKYITLNIWSLQNSDSHMKRKVYKMHGSIVLFKKISEKYWLKYQTLSTNIYTTVHNIQ